MKQTAELLSNGAAKAGSNNGHLSRTRLDMIEAGGRICQILGVPRSTGQIYGLLYLSADPLDLDTIALQLGISKGSASIGTRQLLAWRAIRQVWVRGERRDHFEIEPDLSHLLKAGYNDFIKPRLDSSERRLERISNALDEDLEQGVITRAQYKLYAERLSHFHKIQEQLQSLLPFVEQLF